MHRYIPMQTVVFRKQSLTGMNNLVYMNESRFINYAFIEPKKNSPYKAKREYLNACDNSKFLNETGSISKVTKVINSIMESGSNSQKEETMRYINNNLLPKLNRDATSIFVNQIDKKLLNENYTNSINDTISIYKECDRVLNNDKKLAKRFNFDKFIQENYNKKTPKELVFSLCEMIDTYNISPKQKYYIALESVQYALYNSPVKMDNVVKDITDYFLLRESIIPDSIMSGYISCAKDNQFLSPEELSKLKIIKNDYRDSYLTKINYISSTLDNERARNMLNRIQNISTEEDASQYIKDVYNSIMNDVTLSDSDKTELENSIYMIPLVSGIDQLFIDYEIKKIDGALLATRDLTETVNYINEYFEDTGMVSAPNIRDTIESFKCSQDKTPKRFARLIGKFNINSEYAIDVLIESLPELYLIMRSIYVAVYSNSDLEYVMQEYLYLFDRIDEYADQKQYADIYKAISKEISCVDKILNDGIPDQDISERYIEYKSTLNKSLQKIDKLMSTNHDILSENTSLFNDMSIEECESLITTLANGMDSVNRLNKEELLSSISDNIRLFTINSDNLRNLSNILMISKCVDKSAYQSCLIQRASDDDCTKAENLIIANELSYLKDYHYPKVDEITECVMIIESVKLLEECFFEDIVNEATGKPIGKKKKKKLTFNDLQIAMKAFGAKLRQINTKAASMWQNIDAKAANITKGMQRALTSDRREAIIKGSIIPSMSSCIKSIIAISGTTLVGSFFSAPYVGILTAVGIFAVNKKLNDRERLLIYDEIDTELKVVDKEIEMALQDGDTKKYRFLLNYQKKLNREKTRIKYHTTPIARKIPV